MEKKDKLTMHTSNLADSNFAALAKLFPNSVTETVDDNGEVVRTIDGDVLAQEINTRVVSGKEERYQFTWPDKKKSVLLANAPIAATLCPSREESVDFDNTENLYIEGDNLEVLKLLRETYLNRVKMIYIDPPYNTGRDFLYEDDFSEEAGEFFRRDSQYDEMGNRLTPNLDRNGRFHTDWLNMIYPRLRIARDLLSDEGVIFISIDDNEIAQLRKICDEIFGASNLVAIVPRIAKRTSDKGTHFRPTKDYILVYSKNISLLSEFGIEKIRDESEYSMVEANGRKYKKSGASLFQPSLDSRPNQRYYIEAPDGSLIIPPGNIFPNEKKDTAKIKPLSNADKVWRWSVNTYIKQRDLLIFTEGSSRNPLLDENGNQSKWNVYPKVYYDEDIESTLHPEDVIYNYPNSQATKELIELNIPFSFAKPTGLIKYLIKLIRDENMLFLDFFSGSATSAHAIMQVNAEDGGNRKFIMVQLPEVTDENSEAYKEGYKNICEIGKERIRRAGAKIKEGAGITAQNLDTGFRVLKLNSSNMKEVYYTPEEYSQMGFNLEGFMDNIKPDRSDEDLLFQVMLDLGIPLSSKIAHDGKIFNVNDNYLIACFDKVDTSMITEIAQKQPYYAVFRDSSFVNDSALVNVEQIFNAYSPSSIRRVL